MRAGVVVAVCLVAGLAACRKEAPSTRVELRDEGTLCVGGMPFADDEGSETLSADQPLQIFVGPRVAGRKFGTYLDDECETDRHASCTYGRVGNEIRISSDIGWTSHALKDCGGDRDAVALSADCRTETLRRGHYVLVHGSRRIELDLPGKLTPHCFGPGLATPVSTPLP